MKTPPQLPQLLNALLHHIKPQLHPTTQLGTHPGEITLHTTRYQSHYERITQENTNIKIARGYHNNQTTWTYDLTDPNSINDIDTHLDRYYK